MPLDASMFLRGYNPTPIEPESNALLRGLQLQGARQGNALNALKLQGAQQQMAEQQAAAQRQQAIEQAYRNALETPLQQAGAAGMTRPTPANAAAIGQMQPRFNQQRLAQELMPIAPMEAAKMLTPAAPDYKVVGDALLQIGPGGVKEAYKGTKAPSLPPGMQMGANGPEWIPGYLEGRQKVAQAGSTKLTVNTAEKGLLQSLSGKVGDDVMNASEAARGAQKSLSTVQSMRQALASAKAITGTAANQRAALAQLGYTLGVGPADNPETLAKTREMMMGFGQLELDAAAQMKGQGQITESERAILRRAAAGDITLTVPEIETVLNVSERRAKAQIARNQRNVQTLKRMPNAAPLVDFLEANGESSDNFKMPTAEDIAAEARRRGLGGK